MVISSVLNRELNPNWVQGSGISLNWTQSSVQGSPKKAMNRTEPDFGNTNPFVVPSLSPTSLPWECWRSLSSHWWSYRPCRSTNPSAHDSSDWSLVVGHLPDLHPS